MYSVWLLNTKMLFYVAEKMKMSHAECWKKTKFVQFGFLNAKTLAHSHSPHKIQSECIQSTFHIFWIWRASWHQKFVLINFHCWKLVISILCFYICTHDFYYRVHYNFRLCMRTNKWKTFLSINLCRCLCFLLWM